MRIVQWTLMAALATAVPTLARAQGQPPTPPIVSPPPANAPPPVAPAPPTTAPQRATSDQYSVSANQWTAAGFVGTNFDTNGENASPNYGGSVGYLWRGAFGGELLAASTPDFELTNAFFTGRPMVNTYMANVVGAVPFGVDNRFQPFVSGGVGAIQLRQDIFNSPIDQASGISVGEAFKFGGNIGAGMMAYVRNVGVRGDVRYYRTRADFNSSLTSPSDVIADTALSGLDFWRANIGVAVRW